MVPISYANLDRETGNLAYLPGRPNSGLFTEGPLRRILAVTLLCVGVAAVASADFLAPEIDPGSGVNAIALITAAVLIYRGRRRK
jgi:hypothetical protein